MGFELPKQLQSNEFRFVKLKGKVPFEKKWQTHGYKFNDTKTLAWLSLENNVGVIGGWGRLRIQDIDDKKLGDELIDKFNTFTIRTGSGGCHFYFKSDFNKNFVLKDDLGEFRANNYQVVAPNMKHPNGNFYEVIRDIPIREISEDEFMSIIKPYMRETSNEITNTTPNNTRSEREFKEVLRLMKSGKTKEEIFNAMNDFAKWSTAHPQYRELTYNKALDIFDIDRVEKQKDDGPDFEVIWQDDLENYDLPDVDWLVDKLIPNKAVGVWTGKRGSFKTFLTLTMAANVSQGTQFLDQYPTKKGKVLYLDKENGTSIMKTRSSMIKKGLDIKNSIDIGYICFSQLKIDKNLDIWAIEDTIKDNDIKLLIIDTYRRAISFDENSAGDVSKLFVDVLRPIVERNDCSIILIHHDRKGESQGDEMDMIRGSSDLANYCDFILKNERKGKSLVLKQLKLRHAPEIEPLLIKYETDENTFFRFEHAGEYTKMNQNEKTAEKILIWIESSKIKNFKTSNVKTFVFNGKISKSALFRATKELEDRGIIEKGETKGYWDVINTSQKKIDFTSD